MLIITIALITGPAAFFGAEFVADDVFVVGTPSEMVVTGWLMGIGFSFASVVAGVYHAYRPWW